MSESSQAPYTVSISDLRSKLDLSNRWEESDHGIWSAWAGSSLKFHSQKPVSNISLKIGHKTDRKDRWNGGTPSFAVSVAENMGLNSNSPVKIKTFEAEPGTLVKLWEEPIRDCDVEIMLIDWASVLEIEGFSTPVYDPDQFGIVNLNPSHTTEQMLFIGDSITCGLALDKSAGGQPIPRGVLDAFACRALSILQEKHSRVLSFEALAYPGICLVGGRRENRDSADDGELGMVDRFFHTSPWEAVPWRPRGRPRFICIALGTNDEANDVSPSVFRDTLMNFIRKLAAVFDSVKAFYIVPPFRDFHEVDSGKIHCDLVSDPIIVDDLLIEVCGHINSRMIAEYTVDGLHPTVEGHNVLADNLAGFLVDHLPPPPPAFPDE
ncbi:hypothetical protein R3P38DRAFT_1647259 [Favolaschia claudopus]|uniref:SGNH hydrolase-type esterase domain-containing protein n=1 Tax=Favolaschia claudopus TaxID=2862362 RepID=A0AAW0DLK6_9AGAR